MGQYSIFITAGTLKIPFLRLFDLAKQFGESDLVSHVVIQGVGAEKFFELVNGVEGHEFIDKTLMDSYYKSSDFIVSHCGVGSIVNSVALQKPTILIPRRECYEEHFDDHQMQIFDEVKQNELFLCCEMKEVSLELIFNFVGLTNEMPTGRGLGIVNEALQSYVGEYFSRIGVSTLE